MMPREHTPGPWVAIGNQYQNDEGAPETRWEIQAADGTTVVESVHGDTSVITECFDAALIAAAPELLALTRRVAEHDGHVNTKMEIEQEAERLIELALGHNA